jgi:DNA-binding transcriptional LysR family regulator
MEFQSYHAIIACVAAGSGLAVVPRAVLELARANHNVTMTALPARIAKTKTRLVWRREHHSATLEAMKSLFTGKQ